MQERGKEAKCGTPKRFSFRNGTSPFLPRYDDVPTFAILQDEVNFSSITSLILCELYGLLSSITVGIGRIGHVGDVARFQNNSTAVQK